MTEWKKNRYLEIIEECLVAARHEGTETVQGRVNIERALELLRVVRENH